VLELRATGGVEELLQRALVCVLDYVDKPRKSNH